MAEMERKHEEEMAAVRAECLEQIAKSRSGGAGGQQGEGAGEKQDKTVLFKDEKGGNNSARAEGRGEEKEDKGDNHMLVKVEETSIPVPFVREIMEVHIS